MTQHRQKTKIGTNTEHRAKSTINHAVQLSPLHGKKDAFGNDLKSKISINLSSLREKNE